MVNQTNTKCTFLTLVVTQVYPYCNVRSFFKYDDQNSLLFFIDMMILVMAIVICNTSFYLANVQGHSCLIDSSSEQGIDTQGSKCKCHVGFAVINDRYAGTGSLMTVVVLSVYMIAFGISDK